MQTNHALGIHQIDISQTEEREIGIHTCISCIGCSGSIILQVTPFLRKIAGGFIGHAGYILALTIGKELATLVTIAINIGLGKLIHELRTKTEFTPAGSYTIIGYILVGIRHTYLSTNQIGRRAPAYSMLCTYRQGEDNFVGTLVVISIEELAVIRLQRVAHIHHLLTSLLALGILGNAGINLAVQIKLGKQGIGSTLRSLTVRTGGCRKHITYTILQLALNIIECLLRSITRRNVAAHRVVLCHHRNVAIEIEGMVIEQSAHEADFCLILLHLLCISTREIGIIGIAEELVAEGDVVVDTIIHI